ncbi:hypothetical protein [uncultured Bifidobacterium sp.]|uniref:hypothetical protein n=1 Tax=uncultured Bifidobacterium sp. TaxID=165187 RepID=UPI00259639D4|nr:hypothetical protein [uncultured Bifidobacterium sp.]
MFLFGLGMGANAHEPPKSTQVEESQPTRQQVQTRELDAQAEELDRKGAELEEQKKKFEEQQKQQREVDAAALPAEAEA